MLYQGFKMLGTQYLYGIHPAELENKFYYEALAYKLEYGMKLYKKLYYMTKRTFEQNARLFFVYKAVKHTEKLLREREERE